MSALNLVAFVAVVLTGLTVFARAELMRPRVRSPFVSNLAERWLMDVTAFACVPLAAEIWGGAALSAGLVGFLVASAACSLVMLIGMMVHGGRIALHGKVAETRSEDAAVVRVAVEETVPRALDQAMPAVFKDLASRPDPYEPQSG